MGVRHAAMESTGVYWKPVWHILEDRLELILVNARHIKQVPGRKTDVKDAEWIAQLLQHGLLTPSFVPPPATRELRDLTRHRQVLIQERTRVVNRVHKLLEHTGIKLASVATNILGVSGRAMLEALVQSTTDAEVLADLARPSCARSGRSYARPRLDASDRITRFCSVRCWHTWITWMRRSPR